MFAAQPTSLDNAATQPPRPTGIQPQVVLVIDAPNFEKSIEATTTPQLFTFEIVLDALQGVLKYFQGLHPQPYRVTVKWVDNSVAGYLEWIEKNPQLSSSYRERLARRAIAKKNFFEKVFDNLTGPLKMVEKIEVGGMKLQTGVSSDFSGTSSVWVNSGTDTRVAVETISAYMDSNTEVVYLVSGDRDLVPVFEMCNKRLFYQLRKSPLRLCYTNINQCSKQFGKDHLLHGIDPIDFSAIPELAHFFSRDPVPQALAQLPPPPPPQRRDSPKVVVIPNKTRGWEKPPSPQPETIPHSTTIVPTPIQPVNIPPPDQTLPKSFIEGLDEAYFYCMAVTSVKPRYAPVGTSTDVMGQLYATGPFSDAHTAKRFTEEFNPPGTVQLRCGNVGAVSISVQSYRNGCVRRIPSSAVVTSTPKGKLYVVFGCTHVHHEQAKEFASLHQAIGARYGIATVLVSQARIWGFQLETIVPLTAPTPMAVDDDEEEEVVITAAPPPPPPQLPPPPSPPVSTRTATDVQHLIAEILSSESVVNLLGPNATPLGEFLFRKQDLLRSYEQKTNPQDRVRFLNRVIDSYFASMV